jgi:hypothetical protein
MGGRARGAKHDTAEVVMHLVGTEVEHNNSWGNAPLLGNLGHGSHGSGGALQSESSGEERERER